MSSPLISVCILAGHGPDHLAQCLRSLREQDGPPPFELIVGAGGGSEEAERIRRSFPEARICPKPPGHPGYARNALIREARGDLLLFLDDDVVVAPDLLQRLAEQAARHPHASVFGGPNDTPPASSRFELVQGAVLGSIVGSGPVSRRYGARHAGAADERWFTLCNLAVRRRVMLPFAADLVCAEENELLGRLRARGESMWYDPSLRVFHARRATWGGFARQMFKYGRGRGQLLLRRPSTARVAYAVPSLLLLYLTAAVVFAGAGLLSPLWLTPAALYAGLVLSGAARIGVTLRSARAVPLALGLTLTVHAAYGLGVLRGMMRHRAVPQHAGWHPPLADRAPAEHA